MKVQILLERAAIFCADIDLKSAKLELSKQVFNNVAVDVGQAEVSACIPIREPFVIEAEHVQQRRVQIVHVDFTLSDIEAGFGCRAVNVTAFSSSTGHPHAKAPVMVIAADAFCDRELNRRGSTHFAAPNDECVLQ